MIPKVIHYIWLGGKPKSSMANICILSWKEKLPDYQIIEWNETNLDLDKIASENTFFAECRKRHMWAYMADYLRIRILYQYGGIYFDTDIQVLKPLDCLLHEKIVAGEEQPGVVNAGVLMCEPNLDLMMDMLSFYNGEIMNSRLYIIPDILSKCSRKLGYNFSNYGREYFYPFYYNEIFTPDCITANTYTIHWWEGSWKNLRSNMFLSTKHIHNPVLKFIIKLEKVGGYFFRRFLQKVE